jgi:transposase
MARPDSVFIQKLSKTQVQRLEQLRDDGGNSRIRHRAHAILLSYLGTPVKELVKIFQSNRNTLYSWFDRWHAEGFDGLADKPRCGAPTKLSVEEQDRAIELLQASPQSTNTTLAKIKVETGVTISGDTLKRLAKKKGLVWKRMRKSLRTKRDQKNFATQE